MILKQYYLGCLAHASYLVADEDSGVAAVVDPQRDVDQYLEDARRERLQIGYVFLTHFHADFIAGHLELRDATGDEICLGARAKAEYPFRAFRDGEALSFGKVRLEVLETPGHSPESICIVLFDPARDQENPYAVLTGDTLFIGDVGRPDLRAALGWPAGKLGGLLYDSLHDKLLKLPDETLVYPAHGAGSICGKNLVSETVSTIGIQRRYNYALQPMSKEDFIGLVTTDQPDAPAYFTYDALLNTKERPTLGATLQQVLKPLSMEEVLRAWNSGAQLLDVRNPADFAGAHLAGSINVGLGGQYATWAGALLVREKPILIVADPGHELEAAVRLGRIGFDNVVGYLEGGMQAAERRQDLVSHTARITAATLAEQRGSPSPPVVLDVRTAREWGEKRIGGSLNIPLSHLRERTTEVPRGRPLVVHCQTGYRSSIAASLLEQSGFEIVTDLVGGLAAWEASNLPVVTGLARRGATP